MKRFVVFVFDAGFARGGWYDVVKDKETGTICSFDGVEEAIERGKQGACFDDRLQVVNLETGEIAKEMIRQWVDASTPLNILEVQKGM